MFDHSTESLNKEFGIIMKELWEIVKRENSLGSTLYNSARKEVKP